jgi:hypothetical protein
VNENRFSKKAQSAPLELRATFRDKLARSRIVCAELGLVPGDRDLEALNIRLIPVAEK